MSNKTSLIITVTVAALAVAAVVFTVIILSRGTGSEDGADGAFTPDAELRAEMQAAATRLVRQNSEVFRLFYTAPFDRNIHFEIEPFGEEPSDGFFTLREGVLEHETVDDIFALVDSTFVESAAEEIKSDEGRTIESGPVYKVRESNEGGYAIGVNMYFRPLEYEFLWSEVEIELTFESETEVLLIVTPSEGAVAAADFEGEVESRQVRMLREHEGAEGWRLENIILIYQ
jgi:hypothetical protein